MQRVAIRLPLLCALTHQPFTLLWAGQSVSRLGDHLHDVVLAWWVLQATGSAAAMATDCIIGVARSYACAASATLPNVSQRSPR